MEVSLKQGWSQVFPPGAAALCAAVCWGGSFSDLGRQGLVALHWAVFGRGVGVMLVVGSRFP